MEEKQHKRRVPGKKAIGKKWKIVLQVDGGMIE